MAKLQDGTRIYGTGNVDTALNVNTYFTANASQVKIATPLSANGSTGTAGQILVSGGANNTYWGSTTPLYNYSAQFNGSSSYLTVAASTALQMGTGDFTVEFWINTTDISGGIYGTASSTSQFNIMFNGTNLVFQSSWGVTNLYAVSLSNLCNGSWHHVVIVRASGVHKVFYDGVVQSLVSGTFTDATNYSGTGNWQIGYDNFGGGNQGYISGYISNFRVVKGVAVYTAAFTPPTSPLTAISGTSLLTCNALTLTDASAIASVITNTGPVVASATTYPTSFPQSAVYVPTTALTAIRQQFTGDGTTTQFNVSGGYTPNTISVFVNGVLARNGSDVTVTSGSYITFTGITPPNGSLIDVVGTVPTTYSSITPVSYSTQFITASSQYLSIPQSTALDLPGDFTIEFWSYINSIAADLTFIGKWSTGAQAYLIQWIQSLGSLRFYPGNNGTLGTPMIVSWTPSLNTWYHIALVRSGTSVRFYVNGIQVGGTGSYSDNLTTSTTLAIGRNNDGASQYMNGYISNVRIAKGVAVYTGNFTVPQSPLQATQIYGGPTIQAITGTQTSLLTCNAPTIIDGSTNAFTITNNGTATVSTSIVPTFTNIVMNSTSADAYNSSTGNLGMLFNNTTNRQMLNAFGFQFKNDNGIITPTNKTKVSFYNEAENSWTVPAGVTRIFVKMWGAGGGGGSYGGWRQGSLGGAGGFTHALFNVVPGETVTVRPGGRGTDRPGATFAYPDGGGCCTSGGSDNQYCSNGGGSSSIKIPSVSTTWCLYAGGGGGGGACLNMAVNSAGAGGGLIGQPGTRSGNYTTTLYGYGGTQSAGGAGGTGAYSNGGAGTLGQGGNHQSTYCYGGGGGGGYYGGGSGCYNNSNSMGGGGGGSGFVHSSALFGATYTGSYRIPANNQDSDSQPDNALQYAYGAEESGQGGPGVVVIYY